MLVTNLQNQQQTSWLVILSVILKTINLILRPVHLNYNCPHLPRYDILSSKLEGWTPAPDLNNVVCHYCQKKGRYASSCPSTGKNLFRFSKTIVHFVDKNNQEVYNEIYLDLEKGQAE